MSYTNFILLFCTLFLFSNSSCKDEEVATPKTQSLLSITTNSVAEGDEGNTMVEFTVSLSEKSTEPISVQYKTITESAFPGLDFIAQQGTLQFTPDEIEKTISIEVIGDEIKEGNEKFSVRLAQPVNAELAISTATAIIRNDDDTLEMPEEGYFSAEAYPDFELVWADEFEAEKINTDDWTFEIGNGANGWGNNELQYYTDRPENVRIEDGNLVIEARKESYQSYNYTSTRMKTQDKKTFQFGRIDIRAKMPKGQGIWPALWMLGNDIPSQGWPACGEIDIMELVGHEPATTHGTAHWGNDVANHKYRGEDYKLENEDFSDRFHVFSIHWKQNIIYWYVDDILFYTISSSEMQGQIYPFNDPFFLLFNIAIGGDWPGNPNAATVFPQQMIVDYIRVFQEK